MKTSISYPTEGAMGKTGTWRVFRPVVNAEKCIKCYRCWIFCPDCAIEIDDFPVIDYDYCKGCGICSNECPVKAISMEREGK
ncbi:MAG: 4Fe-4S binding protein [Thermoplasmatales archaeon]|nr:4Fe-4S binding protein [Thermoplasmatales archaeon]